MIDLNRPNPSSPLILKLAKGSLEELYMGLHEEAIFSLYPVMNFDEFIAFAAGSYEMKKSRPIRVEELSVLPSLSKYVGTAHQQVMPDGNFVLDRVRELQEKINASGRNGFDKKHASDLWALNIYEPKTLDERLDVFEEHRPTTVGFLFEQFKKKPKLPFIQMDLEPDALAYALAHPEAYHQVPYHGELTRDKFRRHQTLDEFYALEISKRFAAMNKR